MSIFEYAGKVVMKYTADVGEAKAALKSLAGEEKKLGQERVAALEAHNKALAKQKEKLEFTGQTLAMVAGGFALATKGLEAYAKTGDEAAARVAKITGSLGSGFDRMLEGVGRLVVSMGPLIEALGEVAGIVGQVVEGWSYIVELAAGGEMVSGMDAALNGKRSESDPGVGDYVNLLARDGNKLSKEIDERTKLEKKLNDITKGFTDDMWRMHLAQRYKTKSGGKSGPSAAELADAQFSLDTWMEEGARGRAGSSSLGDFAGGSGVGGGRYGAADFTFRDEFGRDALARTDLAAPLRERLTQDWNDRLNPGAKLGDGINAAQNDQLAKIFGPLDQFDAYATAFQTLTSAVTAAMDAWITGSAPAGEAIKKVLAESLKATASQMAIEALKETAYGIASLAMLNPAKAAIHFKAAGAFALGAAAAGVAARGAYSAGWGGGASGGGAGSSPGAPQSFSGSGGGQAQPERIIVIGDQFVESTPRARQQQAERLVQKALGNEATERW